MSPNSITCSLGACGLEPREPIDSLLMLDAAQPVSEPTYPAVGNAGLMSFRTVGRSFLHAGGFLDRCPTCQPTHVLHQVMPFQISRNQSRMEMLELDQSC